MGIKIVFQMEIVDDWPPVSSETVWAKTLEDGNCVIDNIPFFANQATLGDVVAYDIEGDEYHYRETISESGNSLVRIIFYNRENLQEIVKDIEGMG